MEDDLLKEKEDDLYIAWRFPDDWWKEWLACDWVKLGAHVFHLHVRDKKGRPTINKKHISRLVAEIRKTTSLIIQVSTGGAITDSYKKRLATLETHVEMASLTLGSTNFGNDVFSNPLPFIEKLALAMKDKKIRPELEIFDVGMMNTAHKLIEKGLIEAPFHFNVILGGPGWLAASLENLEFILKKMPPYSTWSASGIGKHQFPMLDYAIEQGGHIRTGLEDNIYIQKGILAKGNAELVEQTLDLASKYQRRLATMEEARKILGISR